MKISQVKIENFRSYARETTIDFGNLTTFVGKNDIGKSTILEALDVFFNEGKGVAKLDKEDINKECAKDGNLDIKISVTFEKLPEKIVIDDANETTLANEYLLSASGKLEILKIYSNAGKEKVYIKAKHPTNNECHELLLKKNSELKKTVTDKAIQCEDKTKNATMRKAIWEHYKDELSLQEVEIDVTKEDAKNIWNKLKEYMPVYSLFQSDRKNSDGDSEIQDPMKLAVQEILKDQSILTTLSEVADKVNSKLKKVAVGTCEKLKEMNPEIAAELKPVIPTTESLKWLDVFKNVSISGEDDIPINKRGSGVKRLILINFFRAEAERRKLERNVPNVVYAIEEPETSQHPDHQKKLIKALIDLSIQPHSQIIITTHSPAIVKLLEFEHLRLIKSNDGSKKIVKIEQQELPYPSLNEVNFVAFMEANEEYHNELYGYIDQEGWLGTFKLNKPTMSYQKLQQDGNLREVQIVLTEYIRHQIHHPENTNNTKYTPEQLVSSIQMMRGFINAQSNHI